VSLGEAQLYPCVPESMGRSAGGTRTRGRRARLFLSSGPVLRLTGVIGYEGDSTWSFAFAQLKASSKKAPFGEAQTEVRHRPSFS